MMCHSANPSPPSVQTEKRNVRETFTTQATCPLCVSESRAFFSKTIFSMFLLSAFFTTPLGTAVCVINTDTHSPQDMQGDPKNRLSQRDTPQTDGVYCRSVILPRTAVCRCYNHMYVRCRRICTGVHGFLQLAGDITESSRDAHPTTNGRSTLPWLLYVLSKFFWCHVESLGVPVLCTAAAAAARSMNIYYVRCSSCC